MLIPILAIGIPLLIIIVMYNSLIGKKNQVENAFGSIDAMLKKRYDLIPNLIATVKTYMNHEKDTFTKVAELRTKAMTGGVSDDEKVNINNQLNKAIGGIMVAVESYPELKANQNFLQLQGSFNEIEEQLSAARRAFNASVTDLNNAIEMFPSNVVAGMMSLKKRALFEIPEVERKNVDAAALFR